MLKYSFYSTEPLEITQEEFFAGFDPYAAVPEGSENTRFNYPAVFQNPREIRFHVKYRF